MKKKLIANIFSFVVTMAYGQVGIGIPSNEMTTEELQMKGNLIISNKVGQVNKLEELVEKKIVNGVSQNTDYRVLAHDPNQIGDVKGQIKEMYGQQNVLPIIIQPYEILNINGDDLEDLNLNIPFSDYFVAKIKPNGAAAWLRGSGGSLPDFITNLCLENDTRIAVAGRYSDNSNVGGIPLPP